MAVFKTDSRPLGRAARSSRRTSTGRSPWRTRRRRVRQDVSSPGAAFNWKQVTLATRPGAVALGKTKKVPPERPSPRGAETRARHRGGGGVFDDPVALGMTPVCSPSAGPDSGRRSAVRRCTVRRQLARLRRDDSRRLPACDGGGRRPPGQRRQAPAGPGANRGRAISGRGHRRSRRPLRSFPREQGPPTAQEQASASRRRARSRARERRLRPEPRSARAGRSTTS